MFIALRYQTGYAMIRSGSGDIRGAEGSIDGR